MCQWAMNGIGDQHGMQTVYILHVRTCSTTVTMENVALQHNQHEYGGVKVSALKNAQ